MTKLKKSGGPLARASLLPGHSAAAPPRRRRSTLPQPDHPRPCFGCCNLAAACCPVVARTPCAAMVPHAKATSATKSHRRSSSLAPGASSSPNPPSPTPTRTGIAAEEEPTTSAPPRFPPCAASRRLLRPVSASHEGNEHAVPVPWPLSPSTAPSWPHRRASAACTAASPQPSRNPPT